MTEQARHQTIDFDRINDATGGDAEFLKELVDVFIEDTEVRLQELKAALDGGDPAQLGRTAHQLKGSTANMGAESMAALARVLEEMGKKDAMQEAAPTFEGLRHEFGRVCAKLNDLVS